MKKICIGCDSNTIFVVTDVVNGKFGLCKKCFESPSIRNKAETKIIESLTNKILFKGGNYRIEV